MIGKIDKKLWHDLCCMSYVSNSRASVTMVTVNDFYLKMQALLLIVETLMVVL